MKFQKTINISIEQLEKLENGEITLQCGQWVKFSWIQKKSRWIGITPNRSIWAIHKNINNKTLSKISKNYRSIGIGE